MPANYLDINRKSWNARTSIHMESDFYNNKGFIAGDESLKEIELEVLGDLTGKKILHLQCHFGQDSISMARKGAEVTAVDLSDEAIKQAQLLAKKCGVDCRFICSDVFALDKVLDEQFDLVFTSYGVLGWLPDINRWGQVVNHFLKPGGRLVLVEFHPVVWMFSDNFKSIAYPYMRSEAIHEQQESTYADSTRELKTEFVMWNHGLGDVSSALLNQQLQITELTEFDYSPYDCFEGTAEYSTGKFRIAQHDNKLPMVYRLIAAKL